MVHAMLVMRAWLVNSLRAQATRSSHLARRAHTLYIEQPSAIFSEKA